MKSMKGKFLKKMKSIKPITQLTPDRVLQVFTVDNIIEYLPKSMNLIQQTHNLLTKKEKEHEDEENKKLSSVFEIQKPEIIDVTDLMKDLEEDINSVDYVNDKENIKPQAKSKGIDSVLLKDNVLKKSEIGDCKQIQEKEIDVLSFRRPDLNSYTLFDPNLLAAFEQAVKEHLRISEGERRTRVERENLEAEQESETCSAINNNDEEEDDGDPLLSFEEKCPPGGDGTVVFYTTTLRGIRKTFEDCSSIRFLLESFRVLFIERDVSMDQEYKKELWGIMDEELVIPPRLFIMGRYIGGAQEVLRLHEQGKLKPLFQNVAIDRFDGPCEGCAGFRFVICYKCNGSHKVVLDDGLSSKCVVCNENGLLKCPYCS